MLTYGTSAKCVTAPILAIPDEVRNEDPDWKNCIGGINGVYDPPIALTPADALAKPTVPGAVPSSTSEPAPASSPKPTDPPVTVHPSEPSRTTQFSGDPKPGQFGSSASSAPDEPAVASFPALPADPADPGSSEVNSLASADHDDPNPSEVTSSQGEAKPKDLTTSTRSSDAARGQQSAQIGQPLQSEPDSVASTTSAGHPADGQPWQETGQTSIPASSDTTTARVPEAATGHGIDLTTNALSVLLSTLSSAQRTVGTQEHQTVSEDPDADSPAASNAVPQVHPSGIFQPVTNDGIPASIIQTAETSLAAISDNETTMTVAQDGVTATTDGRDGVPTFDIQTHSVDPDSDPTVASVLKTYQIDQASGVPAQTTSSTASDHPIAAPKAGSAEASEHEVQTATAVSNGIVSLHPQDFALHHGGSLLAAGMDTSTVPNIASPKSIDVVVTWTNHGSTYTAVVNGGSVQPDLLGVTTPLHAGAKTTIAGEVYDVPAFEYMPTHSGHSTPSKPASVEPTSVSGTMQSVEGLLASIAGNADGDEVVFHKESSAFTLNAGQETEVGGHALSVASDGRAVAVDGSRSVSWPAKLTFETSATDAVAHTKSSTLGVHTSDEKSMPTAGTGVESAAWRVRSDMPRSKLVLIWIAVLLGLYQVLC